jgi:hypothetical protein
VRDEKKRKEVQDEASEAMERDEVHFGGRRKGNDISDEEGGDISDVEGADEAKTELAVDVGEVLEARAAVRVLLQEIPSSI